MSVDITARLVWAGKSYDLKYTFDVARRLRAEGVNIINVYRAITKDPNCSIEYGDEVAYAVAWLLRQAGCAVTEEEVYRSMLADVKALQDCFGLFNWICLNHLSVSPIAALAPKVPAEKPPVKKAKAPAKKRKATGKSETP